MIWLINNNNNDNDNDNDDDDDDDDDDNNNNDIEWSGIIASKYLYDLKLFRFYYVILDSENWDRVKQFYRFQNCCKFKHQPVAVTAMKPLPSRTSVRNEPIKTGHQEFWLAL